MTAAEPSGGARATIGKPRKSDACSPVVDKRQDVVRFGREHGEVRQAHGRRVSEHRADRCNSCGATITWPEGRSVQTVLTVTNVRDPPAVRCVYFNGELVHSCSGRLPPVTAGEE